MIEAMTRFSLFIVVVVTLFHMSGCDNISSYLEKFSSSQKSSIANEETVQPSYEKTVLLEILENQKMLLEEIQFARDIGNKQSIKESYENFLRLDQKYQEEFENHEAALSNKEGWEISKQHQQVVKSLPTYSSLMTK